MQRDLANSIALIAIDLAQKPFVSSPCGENTSIHIWLVDAISVGRTNIDNIRHSPFRQHM